MTFGIFRDDMTPRAGKDQLLPHFTVTIHVECGHLWPVSDADRSADRRLVAASPSAALATVSLLSRNLLSAAFWVGPFHALIDARIVVPQLPYLRMLSKYNQNSTYLGIEYENRSQLETWEPFFEGMGAKKNGPPSIKVGLDTRLNPPTPLRSSFVQLDRMLP